MSAANAVRAAQPALTPLAVSAEALLRAIAAEPEASSKRLAEMSGKTAKNIARDLDILANAGLIVRHAPRLLHDGERALEALDRAQAGPALAATVDGVAEIALALIDRDPTINPRTLFDDEELQGLAESIRDKGVVQPVLLRQGLVAGRYRLVAGERRYRASELAERPSIPAVVRQLTDSQALEIALIENIQRADLNPMEEARAFGRLIEARRLEEPAASEREAKELIAGATRKTVRWVEQRLQLLKLPDVDQARMLLPKDDPKRLKVEAARWAVQSHENEAEKRRERTLKPAELLVMAELFDKIDKDPAKLKDWWNGGKPTEIRYDAAPLKSLIEKGRLNLAHGHRGDARTYAYPGWRIDKKDIAAQLPGFGSAKRSDVLDELRRQVIGEAKADACKAEGRYATAWLNGPFDLDPKLAAQKAKDDAAAAAREAAAEATKAEMSALLARVTRALAGGFVRTQEFLDVPATIGVPLPWRVLINGDIVAANDKTVDRASDWRPIAPPETLAMQLLVTAAVNHAGGFPPPTAPSPADAPGADDDDDDLEDDDDSDAEEEGPCGETDGASGTLEDAPDAAALACADLPPRARSGPLAPMLDDGFARQLREIRTDDAP